MMDPEPYAVCTGMLCKCGYILEPEGWFVWTL